MNTSFSQELSAILDASGTAYRQYLDGGKTFRYAKELKKVNTKAVTCLQQNIHSLPASMHADANELLHHYKVWTEKWEHLAGSKTFADDEEFVFANSVRFPGEAVKRLLSR